MVLQIEAFFDHGCQQIALGGLIKVPIFGFVALDALIKIRRKLHVTNLCDNHMTIDLALDLFANSPKE